MKKRSIALLLVLVLLVSTGLSTAAGALQVSDFTDVPSTAWYRGELAYAIAKGLTTGTGPHSFSPNKGMTRAEFATFLARAMNGSGKNTGKFRDVSKNAYYSAAVYWGVEHGIINGTGKNTFSPNRRITRQDMFTMIGRAIENLNLKLPDVKTPAAAFKDLSAAGDYAKSHIELLRKKGIATGYSDGTVKPLQYITRAEGLVIVVRLVRILNNETVASPSVNGALHVEGTRLVDEHGTPVQLRGVSTHGLSWYPEYVNQTLFTQLRKQWGVNVVRLAMYTEEYNGYCTGGAANQTTLKQLIRNGVEYATKADMYVVVDWHILSDGNPNKNKASAIAFFKEMSKTFAKNDNVIYEICNEPNGGTSWSQIKSYAEEVIPVIRANDPDAVIIVGTPTWSQDVDQAAANPIKGQKNIMYALHFYAATHKADLRKKMTDAIGKGLPVFVSEYGICDASGSGGIDTASANEWVRTMNQYGVSYICWNLSNKSETSAFIKSGVSKTSGFTRGDLTDSGKWLLDMLAAPGLTGTPDTPDPGTSPGSPPATGTAGKLEWSAQCVNSWPNGSKTCYQYNVTVKNTGGSSISGWTIEIPFSGSFTVNQLWNGSYSVSGKTLKITNLDYNKQIAAGGSVTDIGFIIEASGAIRIAS